MRANRAFLPFRPHSLKWEYAKCRVFNAMRWGSVSCALWSMEN